MFDHMGFAVADFQRSKDFYTRALAPLGVTVLKEGDGWAMLGKEGAAYLWFGTYGTPPGHIHMAIAAKTRAEVRAFHAAALAAGAQDNGPPGIRAQYHDHYYGAFVIDPNGHNLEAVCHQVEA